MGSLVSFAAALHLSFVLGLFFGMSAVLCQEQRQKDALCNSDGCFVMYFQRKAFLDSWRFCKEKGGNMATIKRKEDAANIATLFSTLDMHHLHRKVQVWIGLQRQPRQCNSAQPLRGFSWTTGDQDTEYTNWQREDSPRMCMVPRCVMMGYSILEQGDNFKWLDAPCSDPVEGFLCHYTYKGMCPALPSEGGGNAIYTTPFGVLSTLLTHVPLGSVATMPCPGLTKEEETVSCVLKEDGSVLWSGNTPLCSDHLESHNWCDEGNGGCQHYCRTAGAHIYCECDVGYQLSVDGQSCELSDVCHGAPCEFECLPLSDGYRCDCPEGNLLAPDEHSCVDIDECLLSPCEHICENLPGSFVCSCREGYFIGVEGGCEDVDECTNKPCEHECENRLGSYVCHCHLGFSPVQEDQNQCQDIDECLTPWTCEQMCVNYDGGFQCYCEEGYELTSDQYSCERTREGADHYTIIPALPRVPLQLGFTWDPLDYLWNVKRESAREREMDRPLQEGEQPLKWLTDQPRILNSDVIWVTSAPREELPYYASLDLFTQTSNSKVEDFDKTIYATTQPITRTKSILDKNGEDTTTILPMSLTAKTSETTWNWARPTSYKPGNPEDSVLEPNIPMNSQDHNGGNKKHATLPNYLFPQEDLGLDVEDITFFQKTTVFPEVTPTGPPMNEGGHSRDNLDFNPEDGGQKQRTTWVLVAVLVPLCVFIFVILALGVFFCSRCATMKGNKNATDCYHWISGAHDAQDASDHSQVVKSCV